ncbi:MAG TPA: glycosyltransferase family 9 protein [Desulfobacterales bacterium]|nr:glycosyltransferase family 9 protein [Desulfobacterales bacterium]
MKQQLIKFFDSLTGKPACKILPSPPVVMDCPPPASILIIRPGGIGDALLLSPAIKEIKRCYPNVFLTILAEKRNAGAFSLIPEIDELWQYDSITQMWAAIRSAPHIVIDTEQWYRLSAVVARLTGAGRLIGFATNERGRLFTDPIPYNHQDYEINSFLNLLIPLKIQLPTELTIPFLTVPSSAQQEACRLLMPLGNRQLVTLFPGASIAPRRWGVEKFHQLAGAINGRNFDVVVIGDKNDLKAGKRIVTKNVSGINLAGQTTLAQSAAIIERSTLLISGDSGILHMAAGLGVASVSLFGPGIADKWAPRGRQHIMINKNVPCSPCTKFGYTPKCANHTVCIKQISVTEVFRAAMRLLPKQ